MLTASNNQQYFSAYDRIDKFDTLSCLAEGTPPTASTIPAIDHHTANTRTTSTDEATPGPLSAIQRGTTRPYSRSLHCTCSSTYSRLTASQFNPTVALLSHPCCNTLHAQRLHLSVTCSRLCASIALSHLTITASLASLRGSTTYTFCSLNNGSCMTQTTIYGDQCLHSSKVTTTKLHSKFGLNSGISSTTKLILPTVPPRANTLATRNLRPKL